jgi:hypothetical protein
MFNFFKKLFGFDKETMKDANVQLEQQAPYKVEPPVITVEETVKVNEVVVEPAPAAMTTSKKPRASTKTQGTRTNTSTRGRKPKAK